MVRREEYLKKIRPFYNLPVVKVLTGVRRCGKSVMLEQIREELIHSGVSKRQCISLNFESIADPAVRSVDQAYRFIAAKAHAGKRLYLFFDEIQVLPRWEVLVNGLLTDLAADIYVTGSNAYLLSGELATYLGGRYVEIKIYPFSFAEILQTDAEKKRANPSESFKRYLKNGGMPFLYAYDLPDEMSDKYLSDIFDSIIFKDISLRYAVRDGEMLQRLILYFMANIGNTFSAVSLAKYLKNENRRVSTETMYNYIEYCKNACFLHLVPRENTLGKKLLKFQEKIYLADHGFREALYGNNLRDVNQVLENIVYMELLRSGWTVRVGKCGEKEIDFTCEKGGERLYVQVAYLLAADETMEREFSPLEAVRDNFPKLVVSMDEIDRSRNGIRHVNIRKFLLGERKGG